MQKIIALIFVLFIVLDLSAQTDFVVVQSIEMQGNRSTKRKTILREMDFNVGDTLMLTELTERLAQNQRHILNTSLFLSAKINIKNWDEKNQRINLLIELKETWYIFPFPIFELADRNFNVWWEEQRRSLKRVNFGVRFIHLNTTGRKDPLRLTIQGGYTQKYELVYTFPGLNRSQTFGVIGSAFYARNREIAYQTINHKLQFERVEDEYPLKRFRVGVNFFYRPQIRSYHYAKIEYQRNRISDYVINELNPNYFLDGATSQRLFFLRYEYTYENRDIKPYPLRGYFFSGVVEKEGLGIFKERNGLYLTSTFGQYFSLNKRWSTELIAKGKTALIRNIQPYNNYYALGYVEDFLNGYELYVIDGLDYVYLKTALRFEFFNHEIKWGNLMPLKMFRQMPLKAYLSLNNDFGYVNSTQFNAENPLGNQVIWGTGIGLDLVLFYDKVIQFQYSMNHLWEKGLFLHYKLAL